MHSIGCEQIQPWLAQYHDGQLDPITRAIVEAHIAECGHCQVELRTLRRIDRDVADWAAAGALAQDPVRIAGLSRTLARTGGTGNTGRLGGSAAAATARRWALVAGRSTMRLASATTVGGFRTGSAIVRGTRQAVHRLEVGWQRTAGITAGIASTTRWLGRVTAAGAQRLGRGAIAWV